MTTSSPTKSCAKCGAEFKRSPADTTVNCPSCRTTGAKSETLRGDAWAHAELRKYDERFYNVGREDGKAGRERRTDARVARSEAYARGYERGTEERS